MPQTKAKQAEWIDEEDKELSESEMLQNAQIIANRFTNWTPEAISAMVGNMKVESFVNPNFWAYNNPNHQPNHGFGLVQWRMGVLRDWAQENGKNYKKGNTQLDRIQYELDNGEQWIETSSFPMSFRAFTQSSDDVRHLTEVFITNYERPADIGASLNERQAFAEKVYNTLDFEGGGGGQILFIFPVHEPRRITQEFKGSAHYGIDIAGENPGDQPQIHAVADGEVTRSEVSSSYGEVVYIQHEVNGQSWESVYAHMETGSRTVQVGQTVAQDQQVGVMGNTGQSEGVHLHFELHNPEWTPDHGNAVDPMDYLDVMIGGDGDGEDNKQKNLITLLVTDALNGWRF